VTERLPIFESVAQDFGALPGPGDWPQAPVATKPTPYPRDAEQTQEIRRAMPEWTVPATVERVIDADSIVVRADLGWRISFKTSVRLFGVDAPELNTPEGQAAAHFINALLRSGDEITLISHKLLGNTDKYGRVLASIVLPDGRDLSTLLLQHEHARPYGRA
jgi:endonuclease YncB( thermonuclease family)